jgi:prepilin-type N-terminal cleavage/methylation domain-containing protein
MYIFSHTKVPKRGFTLVETLVAVTILMMVIIGPMTIASRGIQGSYFANEQVTAVFLAQEAMESIQQLRDDNALEVFNLNSNESWDWYADSTLNACKNGNGCDFDSLATQASERYRSCATISNCRLHTYTGSSPSVTYGYGNTSDWSTESPYTRRIDIDNALTNGGILVTVTVSWDSHLFSSTAREVKLQTWIYDQYSRFEI